MVGEVDLEVCSLFAFSVSAFQRGENRFRSESFALQIHWEVRGQGSGFQQHRFSRVWCSVSPGSSRRLDGVRHVAFSRQTQVRILQTQAEMSRRESPSPRCKHHQDISAHIPKPLENMREHAGDASRTQQLKCFPDIISVGKVLPASALAFFPFRSGG